ncbi:MAG: type I DNA topoisomerase [Deltaproteobacteria bacterium]|nr:MAG: type I DNA topoisomerase [Deltaproteobacteria bacterium]
MKEKGKPLIIVESPTKARTIGRIVGKDFLVEASVGHIKDLPERELGVDIEGGFVPRYVLIKGKEKVVRRLKKLSEASPRIYLASDPDREGEAIAWHIAEEIADGKEVHRVLIHEITPRGVKEALDNPRGLQESLYRAQQARRILDRLVGYKISPLLWKKVKRGLSAGRVQSVALRLICEREREIEEFVPEEYWTITAELEHPSKPPPFKAKLSKKGDQKVEIRTEEEARAILEELQALKFVVHGVKKKERRRTPAPPFITSTLQQEASKRLRFSVKRTMVLAQQLYEGVALGELGHRGLITYMRTDSVRVAPEAIEAARNLIRELFGPEYLPSKPHPFKSRKGAQEAHEAIRPASLDLPPDKVRPYLTQDQYALYKLIWDRFLASQMAQARLEQMTVEVRAGEFLFNATGTVVKFPGFLVLWREEEEEEDGFGLPELQVGEALKVREIVRKQHFTQPPARYTESSLVKELEEKGIGRPSTYATIITTLQERGYVVLKDRKFHPTELGRLVSELLVANFPGIMDVGFTAQMEEKLDQIEEGKILWREVLEEFYRSFSEELERASREMRDVKRERRLTDIICDRCGSPMEIRWGRYGEFLSCSAFPRCKNAKMFVRDEEGRIKVVEEERAGEDCPVCSSPMVIKRGRYGRFLACSRWPECDFTKPLTTGVKCPMEGCDGELVERRTKRGRIFYSCSRYPECRYTLSYRPLNEPCPSCGHPFLVEGRKGVFCPNDGCDYRRELEEK